MWVKKAEWRQALFLSVGRKNTVERFFMLYITQAMSGTEEIGESLPKVPTCSLWRGLEPRMLVTCLSLTIQPPCRLTSTETAYPHKGLTGRTAAAGSRGS